jgi:hypothetical protein
MAKQRILYGINGERGNSEQLVVYFVQASKSDKVDNLYLNAKAIVVFKNV